MLDGALPLTTRAAFAPSTFNAENRTAELIWTTGARVRRVDPMTGRAFDEELEVSARALDLSRLNSGAPLLDAHNQAGLDNVLGVVETAWIAGNEGRALVRFSPRAAAIADDVRAGIIRSVSVGYTVQEWEEVEAARGQPPIRRAVRWQPHELSLVPVPADAAAQVRGAASPRAPANNEDHMTDTTTGAARPSLADYEAVAASTRGVLGAAWAAEQFRAGTPLAQARDAAIDAISARFNQPPAPAPSGLIVTNPGRSPEEERAARADAIVARALGRAPEVRGAEQFMPATMVDHARDLLMASGVRLSRYASPAEILGRAMHTTSDYPELLVTTADRAIRVLLAAESPVRAICQLRVVPDFRAVKAISFAGPSTLERVVEGGEVRHAPAHERTEGEGAVQTFARAITVSREALINDDLQAFVDPARLFANGVQDLEGSTFAALFASNGGGWGPTVGGNPLYSAGYSTVASGAASTAGIAAGRAAMHGQTRPGGGLARAVPRHVLVGPASETAMEQTLSALALATSEAERPIFSGGRLMMHVEPRLSGAAFFMFDDPASQPVFQRLVLGSSNGGFPLIESFTTASHLGVTMRVVHDFALLVAGRVGTVRVTGA